MPKDLLLEIGTEEMPAKYIAGALAQLDSLARTKLAAERISFHELRTIGTPRRMTLVVRDVAQMQADKRTEAKGPAVKIAFDAAGAPTKAAQGFARGQGVNVSDLVVRDGYVYAIVDETARPVADILPALLPDLINSLTFPKNMRWADFDMRFIRPIRWLVALFGSDVIPFSVADVVSGNKTRGHRFLSRGEVEVNSADDYFEKLSSHSVMVDQEVRRQVIRDQVEKIARQNNGIARIDTELLEEVVYLVEYPTALAGRFEEHYLALPPEAVITPMREHQRYFPVFSQGGKLLPLFITVRNGGSDYIDIVRHGNERVLRARLADAKFFFEEDLKTPLTDRVKKLATVVYQEGLGTLLDKTTRLEAIAGKVAEIAGAAPAEISAARRGAHLAKADLVTGMVCEFTELQGIMGREYAKLAGEEPAVSQTIFEHYLPRFAGDDLPASNAGRAVAIADKMDNIVATFSRGLIPTGSQDPFALRRQALGVVNILIDANWHLSLSTITEMVMDLLKITDIGKRRQITDNVIDFFRLRLKNVLADAGIRYDIVDAVLAVGIDDVVDAMLRARAIAADSGLAALKQGLQALTRAANLADKAEAETVISPELFETDAERELHTAYLAAKTAVDDAVARYDYTEALTAVVSLATSIDRFFSDVMVMVEDPAVRANRLALLKGIRQLTSSLADLAKIVE